MMVKTGVDEFPRELVEMLASGRRLLDLDAERENEKVRQRDEERARRWLDWWVRIRSACLCTVGDVLGNYVADDEAKMSEVYGDNPDRMTEYTAAVLVGGCEPFYFRLIRVGSRDGKVDWAAEREDAPYWLGGSHLLKDNGVRFPDAERALAYARRAWEDRRAQERDIPF